MVRTKLGRRTDPATKPWMVAGQSWDKAADRIAVYDLHLREGRRRRWWEKPSPDEANLRARAEACRWHARLLDRMVASGYIVWHDRIVLDTTNTVDHVLIGPTGVMLLSSIPGVDRIKDPNGVPQPGPVTWGACSAAHNLGDFGLSMYAEADEDGHRAIGDDVPHFIWESLVVYVDPHCPTSFEGEPMRPAEIPLYLSGQAGWHNAFQVQQIAAALEPFLPPHPQGGQLQTDRVRLP